MNRKGLFWPPLFLALIVMAGCASQRPLSGTDALANLPAEPITVWVSEPALAEKIAILRKKQDPGENGIIVARVQLKNVSGEPLNIEAQVLYKDNAGWTLNTSPWVRYEVKPGQNIWLTAPTMAPGTARFFIQIQSASIPSVWPN